MRTLRTFFPVLVLLTLVLAACGGDGGSDEVGPDVAGEQVPGTQTPDSQTPDSQTPDSQTPDSQTPDAQTSDAQTSDTQTSDTQTSDTSDDGTPNDAVTTTVPPAGESDADLPQASDFALTLSDGTEFTLSGEDRPVYLVFWAEWCPTCRGELPKVAEISTDYSDEVAFVAVAGRGELAATTERADELFGDRFLWGLDDTVWDLYRVNGQPVTFLVTGDDTIVEQWFGVADEEEIRSRLDALAAAPR